MEMFEFDIRNIETKVLIEDTYVELDTNVYNALLLSSQKNEIELTG